MFPNAFEWPEIIRLCLTRKYGFEDSAGLQVGVHAYRLSEPAGDSAPRNIINTGLKAARLPISTAVKKITSPMPRMKQMLREVSGVFPHHY